MGSYFSNLHIKNASKSLETIKAIITEYFLKKSCIVSDRENADFEVAFCTSGDNNWLSVHCDGFVYTDILALSPIASNATGTDVLGVACFDSDYLFVNLVNTEKKYDHWLNIGRSYDVKKPRRSNIAAWKKSVENFEVFKNAAKKDHICAEDFLEVTKSCLSLPAEQILNYELDNCAEMLYFSAIQKAEIPPTKLTIPTFRLLPCRPGEWRACTVYNSGGPSRGIRIQFIGKYVENDEITIDNAKFIYHAGDRLVFTPITFEKQQDSYGRWAYTYEDKNYRIPAAVPEDLPPKVKIDREMQREFGIRFIANGNKRKFLDICIVFTPLSNPQYGSTYWRCWGLSGSKQAYVKEHLNSKYEWKRIDSDEYDLD